MATIQITAESPTDYRDIASNVIIARATGSRLSDSIARGIAVDLAQRAEVFGAPRLADLAAGQRVDADAVRAELAAARGRYAEDNDRHVAAVMLTRWVDYAAAAADNRDNTSARDAAVIDRVRGELATGRAFDYVAESNASADRMNYDPPIRGEQYGRALGELGQLATRGDWAAAFVTEVLPGLTTGLGRFGNLAQLNRRAGTAVVAGWRDHWTATSPEPGIPSQHRHAYTEPQLVTIAVALHRVAVALGAPAGIGWALQALADEHGVPTN